MNDGGIVYFIIFIIIFICTIVGIIKTSNKEIQDNTKKFIKYKSVYDYLLHSPQWLSCRERILRRDNHKCQWCKTADNLQIHHKYYCKLPNKHLVNPWEYKDDCFMTLCKDCHDKWHENHSNRVYYRSWRDHQAILKEIKNNERNKN